MKAQAGIIADFSSLTTPAVPHYSLGIAQLEEIMAALWEVRRAKEAKLGGAGAKAAGETAALALPAQSPWRTIAFADTFDSQAKYLFASGASFVSRLAIHLHVTHCKSRACF